MKIIIAAIGKTNNNMPETKLINNYIDRTEWEISIRESEIKKPFPEDILKEREGELLLNSIPVGYKKIILDPMGKTMTSEKFAHFLSESYGCGDNKTAFMIGGAYGHSEKVKNEANLLLSLGVMTFPHILCRLVLVEQIYRAYTIIKGHPYHK